MTADNKQRRYESSLRSKGHKQIRIWLTPALYEALRAAKPKDALSCQKRVEQALAALLGE